VSARAALYLSPLLCALLLGALGCTAPPGRPAGGSGVSSPDQVLDFATLYAENCSGCHGAGGENGAAISLANPVYLAAAGEANLKRATAAGVPGTLMPPFAQSNGGTLTDQQIDALADGMIKNWSRPAILAGETPPAYASASAGDATRGQNAFATFCGRCHGADGAGEKSSPGSKGGDTGSLVDPAYLALVSDQNLRSTIIAGDPEQGMPDWRHDLAGAGARALTDPEITDIVAWLASHRTSAPGQPYASGEQR
jgi:mono/diheme cytochrome c family protein